MLFAGVVISTLLAACAEDPVQRIDLLAFSTTVSLSVYAPPDNFQSVVVPAVEQRMKTLETRWRSFGDGRLGQLNLALERGGCGHPDPGTLELVTIALDYQTRSNGLFDPTLGLEVDAWGFRDIDQSKAPPAPAPADKGKIRLGGSQVCSNGPVRLDLGGIAKGAIVKDLAALLKSYNVENAIINVGGDLLVLGMRGTKPWRVAVQHPRRPGVVAHIAAASGDAIFSSGDYHRSRLDGEAHHILDPRTGSPSIGAIATTVIHSDPLLADVAATALMVAGPSDFEAVAARLGVKRAILIDDNLRVHSLENTGLDLPRQLAP
ncbi:MAG: FAD:protein FMN transferase [Gammaproteobacteria bacterium]